MDATGQSIFHQDSEDYLTDFNGNLLCRFDEAPNGSQYAPADVSNNDAYASILDIQKNERRIYALPR